MRATASSDLQETRGNKRMLSMLLIAFAFKYADLAFITTLCEAVGKEFHLTDLQTGLICSATFAVTFGVFAVAMGWLADRFNRRWIITLSLALWGGLTIASGFAWNVWQILAARAGVSIGQASMTPAAHSIISGMRPAGQRARAMGVYGLGVPIGAVAGMLGGAWITQEYGWRIACFAIGAPGAILAILFRLIVRSGPPRPTAHDIADDPVEIEKLKRAKTPSLVHFILGLTVISFIGFAYLQFTLPMLKRNFDLSYFQAAALSSLINGVGGALGIYAGGVMAQRLAPRDIRVQARIPAIACLAAGALFLFALLQTSLPVLAALMFAGAVVHGLHFAPSFASIQDIAAPQRRGVTTGWAMGFVGVIGIGFGPLALGALSDSFAVSNFDPPLMYHGLDFATACATRIIAGNEQACAIASASGLKQAMLVIILGYLWAAAHFARAARTLRQDTGLTLPHERREHVANV